MKSKEIALKFAKSKGFTSVKYKKDWNGFEVFIATTDSKEIHIVGYPFFILVKDGKARESESHEPFKIMGFNEPPIDFAESL